MIRVGGETTWRGFDHAALINAISSDLSEAGWSNDPVLPQTESSACRQAAGSALLKSLFKKWPKNAVRADSKALLTFLEANHLSEKWAMPVEFSFTGRLNTVFNRVKWEIDKFLHPNGIPLISSYQDLWHEGYSGPGSSIGARGYSFYAKHGSSRLTSSSEDLYLTYRRYIQQYPTWAEAECLRAKSYGLVDIVDSSNVSFAPKNADTARLICTEPSLNMFAQLGLKRILDKRMLELWGVDMEDQPEINRLLAKWGSQNRGFGTLDLASASDSVSVELCRQLLPEWFFNLLMDLRSPACTIRDYGLCRELGMISTMGNGFTFPVMTIILSCIVRAVYQHLSEPILDTRRIVVDRDTGPFRDPKMVNIVGNWAVFGDDIIVRSNAYDCVVEVLGLMGFTVNLSKSFNQGPFRESCGHDYYRGLNIRGVYFEKLASLQDLAVAVNLLVQWTSQTGICLRRGCKYLMSLFRDNRVHYVPYSMPEESGIRVPRELIPSNVRTTRKGADWRYKLCFRAWDVVPLKVKFGDGIVMVPSGFRRLGYNSHMLLLSCLQGEVRDGEIGVRQIHPSLYRTQWHVTPNWDYVPPSYWFNHRSDWQRFASAVYSNLFE